MRCIFATIVFFLIFTGFVMNEQQDEYFPSEGEKLVNSTLSKTAGIIKEKYRLKPCGQGAAMPGGPIQELTLCFDSKNSLKKEELRSLLINLAQELINQVNGNSNFKKFLKKAPFTIENVQIIIYNHDKDGRYLYDPMIGNAQIQEGLLTYSIYDPQSDILRYKYEFKETYEEALKAISTQ